MRQTSAGIAAAMVVCGLLGGSAKVWAGQAEVKESGAWPAEVAGVAMSEDGKHVAAVVEKDGKRENWIDGVAGAEYDDIEINGISYVRNMLAPEIVGGGYGLGPMFSPDGKRVVFAAMTANKRWMVVADGKPGRAFDGIKFCCFTPDSKKLVYVAAPGKGREVVVVDGVAGPEFDTIEYMMASPDSKHIAYVGINDNVRVVVFDGRALSSGYIEFPQFSRNSRHFAYVVGEKGKPTNVLMMDGAKIGEGVFTDLVFSPDGNRTAWVLHKMARPGTPGMGQDTLVLDGREAATYEQIRGIWFSPDSRRVAWISEKNGKRLLVVDGKEREEIYVGSFVVKFSPDSKRIAYITGNKPFHVVVDGKDSAAFDGPPEELEFSADSKRCGYVAIRNGREVHVVDGVEAAPNDYYPDPLHRSTPKFSPDSKHVFYLSAEKKKVFVVADGVAGEPYDEIALHSPVYSADSKHLAYWGRSHGKWELVVDGKTREVFDWTKKVEPARLVFDAKDGLEFLAVRDGELVRVKLGAD